ncbi:hypothetical protein ACFV5C_38700, partial [Streptomyces sp. NPDC059762]
MGIESDRMVFDYLSEVGDLAQQRQLPPGDRSALVAVNPEQKEHQHPTDRAGDQAARQGGHGG